MNSQPVKSAIYDVPSGGAGIDDGTECHNRITRTYVDVTPVLDYAEHLTGVSIEAAVRGGSDAASQTVAEAMGISYRQLLRWRESAFLSIDAVDKVCTRLGVHTPSVIGWPAYLGWDGYAWQVKPTAARSELWRRR